MDDNNSENSNLIDAQKLTSTEITSHSAPAIPFKTVNPDQIPATEPAQHLSKFCGVWRAKNSTLRFRRPNGEKCRLLIIRISHTPNGLEIVQHLATTEIKSSKFKYHRTQRVLDEKSNQLQDTVFGKAVVSNSLREVSENVGQLRTIYEVISAEGGYVGVEGNSTVREILEVSSWNQKGLTYSVKIEKCRQKNPICFGKLYSESSGIVYFKRIKEIK